jgi:ABC-type nitrate/sulfonate/bicarbonate transport system substrate-binding protein
MQATSVMPAFASKQIDGFAQSLPWTLVPVVDGSAVVIASGPDGDPPGIEPFAHNLVLARPETCVKRKSVCDKVGHVYAEAMRFIHEHPAEALAVLQKRFTTIDPNILAPAFEEMRKATPATPIVSKAAIENAEIYSIDAGLMKPADKLPSYDGLYTDAFVR